MRKDIKERKKATANYIAEFYKQYPDGIVPEFYCKIDLVDGFVRSSVLYRGDERFEEAKQAMRDCKAMRVVGDRLIVCENQSGKLKAKRLKFNKVK